MLDARAAEEARFVISTFLKQGDIVLDAACGYGRHTAEFAQAGFRVIGVDASEVMTRLAKERTKDLHPQPEIFTEPLATFTASQPVDVCLLAFSVLGYGTQDEDHSLLEGLARNIRPGGVLLLEGKNPEVLQRITKDAPQTTGFETHWLEGDIWHMNQTIEYKSTELSMRLYTADSLTKLLEQSGFTVGDIYNGFSDKPFHTQTDGRYLVVATRK